LRNWSKTVGCAAILFALNLVVCYRMFALQASAAVFSTDAIYIGISRYMLGHWRDLSWWPIWYGGVPWSTVYPPLLHTLTALLAAVERGTVALAHHQISGLGYALGPVTLFLMAYRLSGALSSSFFAGLFYSLLSPANWLAPWARGEIGGVWRPFRLHILLAYGDAPHVFALTLLPLAILALDVALEKRTWPRAFAAVAAIAAVLLCNWVGTVAMAGAILAHLLWRKFAQWRTTAGICAAAYLVASPFISPENVRMVSLNSQAKSGNVADLVSYAVLVALAIAAAKFLLPRKFQFAAFLLIFPGTLPLLFYWGGLAVIPEPHRYLYEMEMAVCLLLAAAIPRRRWLYAVLAILAIGPLVVCCNYAKVLIRPADLTNSMEFQTARWLNDHTGGSRVYARGTVSWWLNALTDVPQLGGGVSAAIPSRAIFTADDTLSGKDSDPDGVRTLQWLRAYGVDYAAVGPMVTAQYSHPERFDKIADKVWAYGPDFVYRIPRRSRSLAHVIPRGADSLAQYVSATEDAANPEATFHWLNAHEARVTASVPTGDVLSVQVSYAPGWRATVNGLPRPVTRDALGLIRIDPGTTGPCSLHLTFGRSVESILTSLASMSVLLLFAAMSIRAIIEDYVNPPVCAAQQ
jgi:hypothetical protein